LVSLTNRVGIIIQLFPFVNTFFCCMAAGHVRENGLLLLP